MDGNAAMKTKAVELTASDPKSNLRPPQRVQSLRLPEAEEAAGAGRRWLWLLVVIAVVVVGYFAYKQVGAPQEHPPAVAAAPAGTPSAPANSNAANGAPAAPISTSSSQATATPPHSTLTAPVASSGEIAHESKGYIIAAHQILVSPRVYGMLQSLRIEEGQRVKKGDILAQLETTEWQADYDHAKAAVGVAQQKLLELENGNRKEEIAEAQAALQEEQAQRVQLYAELQRTTQLRKNGVATQSDYDTAEANSKPAIVAWNGCKRPTT